MAKGQTGFKYKQPGVSLQGFFRKAPKFALTKFQKGGRLRLRISDYQLSLPDIFPAEICEKRLQACAIEPG